MVKYFCDRCGKEITKGSYKEILMLHGELMCSSLKKTRKWLSPVLCDNCTVALEDWLHVGEETET